LKTNIINEIIREDSNNQRIDNFLFKRYRNVPKSHIYQLLRSGQVRVNGKRIVFHHRLVLGDTVRIPPIAVAAINTTKHSAKVRSQPFSFRIIFEDEALLVVDKPSGMAVHGGSGISFGVIEQLRAQRSDLKFLELVHRLDRETSGVLLLAKKRSALVALHQQIVSGQTEKHYQVLVKGRWTNTRQHVKLPLLKYVTDEGERRVTVAGGNQRAKKLSGISGASGVKEMASHTIFTLQKVWQNFSLLDAELKTGRTHQIRVHLAHLGYPIVGDDKYGDFSLNKLLARKQGKTSLNRMFLHASSMQIKHPINDQTLKLSAPLPTDLQAFINHLEN